MNRRTGAQRQDGSAWSYGYNARGEVTSAAKGTEPGKQFAFEYDGLGNRTGSSVSSLADPAVLRTTGYTPNGLNQYDAIAHPTPGWLVLRGSLDAAGATVTIDGNAPTLSVGTLWFHEQSVDNSSGPVRRVAEIEATRPDGGLNNAPVTTQRKGSMFIPPPSEVPTYDLDGNLTSDARWSYTWDGENRLIAAEENVGGTVKRWRLEFSYDAQGRRISKSVLTGSGGSFVLQQSLVMLYDGWNMIAEIDTTTSAQLLRSYEWGTDVSGTMTGAGGVGGLLIERFHAMPSIHQQASSHAPLYDGNGNVTELVNLTDGKLSARYEYGAFGETISVDGGAVASANPFRFSTKYLDRETGWYNYGLRLYDPPNARWLSRDPIGISGGINVYGMVGNNVVNEWDYLGMQAGAKKNAPTYKLGFATSHGPEYGDCGNGRWDIDWKVTQNGNATGPVNDAQILQVVRITGWAGDCKNKVPIPVRTIQELWQLSAKGMGRGLRDTWSEPDWLVGLKMNKCDGEITYTASAVVVSMGLTAEDVNPVNPPANAPAPGNPLFGGENRPEPGFAHLTPKPNSPYSSKLQNGQRLSNQLDRTWKFKWKCCGGFLGTRKTKEISRTQDQR